VGLPGGLGLPGGVAPVQCSLRAIALACDMLVDGKLDLALAGGVSMGVDPAWHAYRVHLGAPAGEDVRVYDSDPTGGLPGEGCGVAALMRAADARDADLPVYAEIIGWHAGDDVTAQSDAIRGAYLRAGVDPADVQFVEGHGAATAVEDLAELTALLDVLTPRHAGIPGRCALGSVTANIGDTRAAAGAAALLKTALAMTAGIVPPTTGCVRPHQLLRAGPAPFLLPDAPAPWPETTARLAAVNSLGAADLTRASRSGPVHLVLRRERDPRRPAGRRRRVAHLFRDPGSPALTRGGAAAWRGTGIQAEPAAAPLLTVPQPRLPMDEADREMGPPMLAGPVSGETVVAIRGVDSDDLAVMLDAVAVTAGRLTGSELREFALELAATPPAGNYRARAAIVAGDPGQLAERARRGAAELRVNPSARTAGSGVHLSQAAGGRVVLLFPGLVSTAVEQSAVLSASMVALDTAERLGVHACAAVGYSFGEIMGLAWAGAITFGEAARFAAHRAQIIRAMPGRTAMARLLAAQHTVTRLCDGTSLTLAAQEGPRQHVVAGPVAEIRDLPQRAAILDADVELLNTTHALHSPAMAPSVAPMRAAVAGLRFTAPWRRLVSTVTGLDVTAPDVTGPADPAELLAAQLTRPALLAGALALAGADADLIVVTARDPALAEAASGGQVPVVQAPLEQRSGPVMTALAAFYAAGAVDSLRPFLPEPEPSYFAARA
jgi:enediyne polyketide synthase